MECSVCRVRSAIGFCKTCERELCEVCGIPCTRCKKLLCRVHRQTTPGGRNLCPECMEDRNQKRARREAAKEEEAKLEPHSFQALMSDFDDELLPGDRPPPEPVPVPEVADYRPDWAGEAPAEPAPREEPRKTQEDELNARVLMASAPKPRPMWVNTLIVGMMACLMVYFGARIEYFKALLQPWMSYGIILVAVGAVVLGFTGFQRKEDSIRDRRLCFIGITLALIAIAGAWVIRAG